jgi:hypothetical protein
MAVGFDSLDKRINRDTRALHDFLWQGDKKDEKSLTRNLHRDARDADAFLRLDGRLRRTAESLLKNLPSPGNGESLFELLDHSWGLGAATVLQSKGNHRAAAERTKGVVSSASIGVCANAGCFEFVEEWEAGKIDFETYTSKLADFLEPKGYMDSGQFKRLLNAVYEFGMNWNTVASKSEQALAARTSIQSAAWCLLTSVAIRELLGAPPEFPARDFAAIVERIADRA